MKVKITLNNGNKINYNDVTTIKTLANDNKIVIENKEVCQFQFIDKKPKLQKVKTYINKYEIEKIEILEV